MAFDVTFRLQVPDLPESNIWFANSSAWSNYWADVGGVATIDAIATELYDDTEYDNTLEPYNQEIGGVVYQLATVAMLNSVLARVDKLNLGFETMRNELKNAGLITNAQ